MLDDEDLVEDIEVDLVEVLEDTTEDDQDQVEAHLVEVLEDIQDKDNKRLNNRKHQRVINGVFCT